jgi:hypothetical protein
MLPEKFDFHFTKTVINCSWSYACTSGGVFKSSIGAEPEPQGAASSWRCRGSIVFSSGINIAKNVRKNNLNS